MVRALPTLAARARRTPAPALALGTYALAHVLLIASFGDQGAWGFVNDALYLPLTVASAALAIRTARDRRASAATRRAWGRIAFALAAYAAGSAVWFGLEHGMGTSPYPSVADSAFLAVYPAMLWGLLTVPARERTGRSATLWLDVATVVAGTWMALWYFVVGPALQTPGPGSLATLLSTAYPVGDMVLLLGVATAWMRGVTPAAREALGLLAAGLVLQALGNLMLSVSSMAGEALPSGSADVAWATWTLLAGLAAQRQYEAPAQPGRRPARRPPRIALLPAAAVALSLAVLWAAVASEPLFPLGGLMVGLTALVASVLLRQVISLHGAVRAREDVAARERTLETAIDERTAELTAAEAHFRGLVQHSSDVTTFVDRDLIVRWQSESVHRLMGWDPDLLIGRSVLEFLPGGHRHPLCEAMRRATAARGVPVVVDIEVHYPPAAPRQTESAVTRLLPGAPQQGWVINTRDVTPQRELESELTHQAFHDPLTGLANRSLLSDRLAQAIARASRSAAPLAVLAIDLDDFKSVNDSLGHAAGDALLCEVARRLELCVREGDTVARLGGDEFAVLLEPGGAELSAQVAERILGVLRAVCPASEIALTVEASIGIAHTEHDPATATELLRNADLALYRAKADGKHGVCTYQAELHDRASRRLELQSGLRRALELGELSLQYQPVFQLDSGELIGAEALLRWTHPRLGPVSPGEFIPIAEQTGLIVSLGAWVLEQACAEAAAWPGRVGINVNLSAIQLAQPEIAGDVRDALSRSGLAPARLTIEITESTLVDDVETTAGRLDALKALGVSIAIDDFGTGYSSLSALSHFPADVLKIDRSFVSAMCESPRHHDVVTTIVRLGQAVGMTTVAEGIETGAQQEALEALGCDVGQGYLFARPLDIGPLRDRMTTGRPRRGPAAAARAPR